jgi:hypothetical protein
MQCRIKQNGHNGTVHALEPLDGPSLFAEDTDHRVIFTDMVSETYIPVRLNKLIETLSENGAMLCEGAI